MYEEPREDCWERDGSSLILISYDMVSVIYVMILFIYQPSSISFPQAASTALIQPPHIPPLICLSTSVIVS